MGNIDESRKRFEAQSNDLGRGNQSVGFCARGDLRATRQAAGGRQGAGAMEVSP